MPLNFLYKRDILFGSLALAFSTQWKGHGLAHIADLNLLLKVIKWAQIEAHIYPQPTKLTIINHDKWSTNLINPLLHTNITPIITIPSFTIQYTPTPTLPTYYSHKEPLLISILTLSHTSNQHQYPPLYTLSQMPLPLYVPPTRHPPITINIPPTKTRKAWHPTNLPPNRSPHTNPYPSHHPKQTSSPYNSPPAQPYYTDGSFTPLDGESNGNIAGLGYSAKPSTSIHPKVCNINLHNITCSLINWNPSEWMFVTKISFLIVTFLSLISQIFVIDVNHQRDQLTSSHYAMCQYVECRLILFLLLMRLVECWCMHMPHCLWRPSAVDQANGDERKINSNSI